jgi:tetratricopeptide (TPR) repeat protein
MIIKGRLLAEQPVDRIRCCPTGFLAFSWQFSKAADTNTMNLFSRCHPSRTSPRTLKAVVLAGACVIAPLFSGAAWATTPAGHARIERLLSEAQYAQALTEAEALLRKTPSDPLARLLAGVSLIELNRLDEARQHFEALTKQFPLMPEAWNNLAVVHARKGELEQARTALEKAMRTHPSYAATHDNLGDVYAGLASQAYDKALQDYDKALQIRQPSASQPATPLRETVLRPLRTVSIGERGVPPVSATLPLLAHVDPLPTPPAKPPTAANPVSPAQASATPAVPIQQAAAPPVATQPDIARASAQEENSAHSGAILTRVEGWAKAWSDRDVPAYLAFYADTFEPPERMTRAQWERQRRDRITAPSRISVSIVEPKVVISGQEAHILFTQHYRSSTFNSTSLKRLDMILINGVWQIRRETSGA